MARLIKLSDFPTWLKKNKFGINTHSPSHLCWGNGIKNFLALFSSFANIIGNFSINESDKSTQETFFIQAQHTSGSEIAHLTYLSPAENINSHQFPQSIEYLITKLGERKAHCLVVESPNNSALQEELLNNKFSAYAQQNIWKLNTKPKLGPTNIDCRWLGGADAINLNRMYNNIIPHQVRSIETGPLDRLKGVVCYRDGELAGYADISTGPLGTWAQPFIPSTEKEPELILEEMLYLLSPRSWRPIYICVRSYQHYLEPVLKKLGAIKGPDQIVLARRLTSIVKKPVLSALPQLNGSREASTPFSNSFRNKKT